ncbi:hypothetical protein BKI52_21200 [marine bacterium AO1-C]|nr:hypothetical protein BKI52_21200 [marine bacterium AO1-C]
MKKILFGILFLLVGIEITAQSPKITDVFAEQDPNNDKQIIIHYTLNSPMRVSWYNVTIHCSLDGGKTFGPPLTKFVTDKTGSTGQGLIRLYWYNSSNSMYNHNKPGKQMKRKAHWKVFEEMPEMVDKMDNVVFEVRARRSRKKFDIQDDLLPRMVLIKGGEFTYTDILTKEDITTNIKDFYLARYETTNEDFLPYANLYNVFKSRENSLAGYWFQYQRPMSALKDITFKENYNYCKWMKARFPTFEEWLYAARGGRHKERYTYSGSSNPKKVAQHNGSYSRGSMIDDNRASVIGQLMPNSLGLYDMSGNVHEMVAYYTPKKASNKGTRKRKKKRRKKIKPVFFAIGGGRFSNPNDMRLDNLKPKYEAYGDYVGLRVAKDVPIYKDQYIAVKEGASKISNQEVGVNLKSFKVSTTEITNEAYAQFLNFEFTSPRDYRIQKWIDLQGNKDGKRCRIFFKDGAYQVESGYEKAPVIFISHLGARAYAMWRGGRLPTEAEWEYAVRQKVLDISQDQVWQWCRDYFAEDYFELLAEGETNPMNVNESGRHSVRGKGKLTNRNGYFSNSYYPNVGFRVVIPGDL